MQMEYTPAFIIMMAWIALSIWSVNDISKFPRQKRSRKLVWTNIVVLFPFAGLLAYLVIGRNNLAAD